MKILGIFVAISVLVSHTNAAYQLDLKTPIYRVIDQIQKTVETPPIWADLPGIIMQGLTCLSPTKVFKVEAQLPSYVKQYLEDSSPASLAQDLLEKFKTVDWKQVPAIELPTPMDLAEDLEKFMNTSAFATIHNHIWTDPEFLDVIKFFHDTGFTNIYKVIKDFYTSKGQPGLGGSILDPDAPPALNSQRRIRTNTPIGSSLPSTFPVQLKGPVINKCDGLALLGLLNKIKKANFDQVIKVFLFLVEEIAGNAAPQALLIKLGESQKGVFFHETLQLPEMKEAMPLVQQMVLNGKSIKQLNTFIKALTGLSLENIDLFAYIVNLIEYLVWNYPFPA